MENRHFYVFGQYRVDLNKRRLLCGEGETVHLAPKEFELLLVLIENRERVVDKNELLEKLWSDVLVEEGTLTRNISRLRQALGENKNAPRFIETTPKFGYRFIAEVTEEKDELQVENNTQSYAPSSHDETAVQNSAQKTNRSSWLPFAVVVVSILLLLTTVFFVRSVLNKRSAQTSNAPKIVPFSGLAGREDMPAFSQDGKQLAFAWKENVEGNFDIYIKLIGAGAPLRLTTDAADDVNPAWSPDGRFVAFVRSWSNRSEVILVPALGGAERKVCELKTIWSHVAWSPDGKSLLVSDGETMQSRVGLFLVNIETGAKFRLTTPQGFASDENAVFSPNGKTLAFKRTIYRSAEDIFITDVNANESKRLTFGNAPINGLTWTSDSAEILFSSYRENANVLLSVNTTDGKEELLTVVGRNAINPSMATNGHTLAFVEKQQDTNIWLTNLPYKPDMENQHNSQIKLINSNRADHSPQFSPDGKRIVFVSSRTGSEEIWVSEADGSNPTQLTSFGGPSTGTPRWSTDGKQIVFDSRPDKHGDIFTISANGGTPRRLTTLSSHDVIPNWSRDGKWIYFCSNRSGTLQIWKMPSNGSETIQITKQGGMEAFESVDEKYIYYSKARGISELWRVSKNSGVEEPVPELSKAALSRNWAISNLGIYFVSKEGESFYQLKFFDFATRQTSVILNSVKEPVWLFPGLAVSPDASQILYTQNDQLTSSIMLLENFR